MIIYPDHIDEIITRFENAGERAYIVGGSLRDMIIGLPPHDFDIATSALPQKTAALFADKRVIETGIKHGTVTVLWNGEPVEITTFRVDGDYTDARHPNSVSFTSEIEKDLSRRDFTVNAMAYNRRDGLVDVFGGESDIKARIIRAVGDPRTRFSEDALRIMRAFRFCAQLGFEIERGTLDAAAECAPLLVRVARERIGAEFLRLICSQNVSYALEKMIERGVIDYVFEGYTPSGKLVSAVGKVAAEPASRLALLLSETDEDTARTLLNSLRCSAKQITGALAIRRGAFERVESELDARKLIAKTGIYASSAAQLSEALGVSDIGACELVNRQINTPSSVRDLAVNGKDIAELGAKGKNIGATLEALLGAVIDDPTLNERFSLLELARKFLEKDV